MRAILSPSLVHSPRRGAIAISTVCALVAVVWLAATVGPVAQSRTRTRSTEQTITHDGRQRSFLVHDFSGAAPAPLVVILHGGGGNAQNAVKMTGFDRVAGRERFIAVYPNGTANRSRGSLLTWNAGHCCAAAMTNDVDDVGFIRAVIDSLVASGDADATRVYVTGMSNGGMMSHRLGRELSSRIAAIGPVVGAVLGDEPPPAMPVAAFIVVGADDRTVPAAGGPLQIRALLGRSSAADRDVAPAEAQGTYWAQANGCGEPTRTRSTVSSTTEWRQCRSGKPVVFHSVADSGHAWPGGEAGRRRAARPQQAFDASEAMWTFFKAQRR